MRRNQERPASCNDACHATLLVLPQPINKQEFGTIFGPAAMHALGHIAANISFAAVAISLTHTVKTLEPAFNVVLSQLILGESTPLPVLLTLLPIMVSRDGERGLVWRRAAYMGVARDPGAVMMTAMQLHRHLHACCASAQRALHSYPYQRPYHERAAGWYAGAWLV